MAEGFDIRHDQTFGVELYELEVPEAAEARPEVTRRLPQLSPRLRAMVKWGVGLISAVICFTAPGSGGGTKKRVSLSNLQPEPSVPSTLTTCSLPAPSLPAPPQPETANAAQTITP